MIIKKKRINSLSCLNHVEEGKNLMMVLRDAARFKGILVKLGFSEDLIEGERVLPSMLNPTLKRNAEPFILRIKQNRKNSIHKLYGGRDMSGQAVERQER